MFFYVLTPVKPLLAELYVLSWLFFISFSLFPAITATPNRVRREARGYVSQTSSATEAASDDVDLEMEPERVTT